jgi:CDGSH-type Zn-finger protein/uncharacterized Fe-S cluster protein YjdI
MSEMKVFTYDGDDVDVHWDGRLCIHVGECGRAEGDLFVGGRQPWCQPDLAGLSEIEDVVRRCPTGALTLTRKSGGEEEKPAPQNRAVVSQDGPVYLEGDLHIENAPEDMPGTRFRAALCRCGASKNKPFCDNSHQEAGFRDSGAVGKQGEALAEEGGPLEVRVKPNGPVIAKGNLRIISGAGREAWSGTMVALCRCGESNNKPFCDGMHAKVGFVAE